MSSQSKSSLALALMASIGLLMTSINCIDGANLPNRNGNNINEGGDGGEMIQANLQPSSDPELESLVKFREQLQQVAHQHKQRQSADTRFRRQTSAANLVAARKLRLNNEADVAALLNQQQLARQQQQQLSAPRFPAVQTQQQQQQANQLQQQQSQLFEDEQAIKRQLHDLIAQAPNDKSIERALLKMVINASLRNALSNMAANSGATSSQMRSFNGASLSNDWRQQLDNSNGNFDNGANSNTNNNNYNAFVVDNIPHLSARLEQAIGDYANIDPMSNDLTGQAINQLALIDPVAYQAASQIDKREYIKPCSFNAVSCARNVLRRPL